MLLDTSVPGSDDWYLVRLCNQLGEGLPRMHRLQSYRDGDALIPLDLTMGERESYIRFMKRSRLHVVETLRNARTDRQKVIGFRTAAAGDESGDAEAWKTWKKSAMPVQSRGWFNDTADFGKSYTVTLGGEERAYWQIRNGWDATDIPDPVRPWLSEAGLTVGYDAINEVEIATLYRPGYRRMAYRRTKIPTLPKNGALWFGTRDWTWTDPMPTPWTRENTFVRNQTPDGLGIYEKHLDTVDRINEITLNGLSLIVQQAYRQRWVEGNMPEHYPEGHPQAGQKIDYNELFQAGPAALWFLGTGNKLHELSSTDVRPIYEARKHEVEALASLTSTPQYVFQGDSANQSANGADLAREQIVFAVEAMNDIASLALAQMQALAFAYQGDAVRSDVAELEVMWKKVNPATLPQRALAAKDAKQGGATQRWIDEHALEMDPGERRQAEQDRVDEAFLAALNGGTDANDSGADGGAS